MYYYGHPLARFALRLAKVTVVDIPSMAVGSLSGSVGCTIRAVNTTRTGVKRNNPAQWRKWRDQWDNAGYGDALSAQNRANIAKGRSPIVDDKWVKTFPEHSKYMGQKISPHHVSGLPVTVPLPKDAHLNAHMPGGFRYNPGGSGGL